MSNGVDGTRHVSVFHPSDFSEGSDRAFAHALKLATAGRAALTIFHAEKEKRPRRWTSYPAVRGTLIHWGLLDPNAEREDVLPELGVEVRKVAGTGSNPLESILEYLEHNPTDIIVLSTRGRQLPHWLRRSVAENLMRRTDVATIFVPEKADGFVAPSDGAVTMERILVPVAAEPGCQGAVFAASRLAHVLTTDPVTFTLLHVGESADRPRPEIPEIPVGEWREEDREGDVVEAIVHSAKANGANAIVMTTAGHHGILDAIRGSTSERVLNQAPCPVVVVPPDWRPLRP